MQEISELLSDNFDFFPSASENIESIVVRQWNLLGPRPNDPVGNSGPEWESDMFWYRGEGSKSGSAEVFDGENLKREAAECTGAYVHQETISSDGFTLVIECSDVGPVAMPGIPTHPHLDK